MGLLRSPHDKRCAQVSSKMLLALINSVNIPQIGVVVKSGNVASFLCRSRIEQADWLPFTATHLMTVPLAPPAVVSMTRVVRLPRRSSSSSPSSAAQHSSTVWLRAFSVQPPASNRHSRYPTAVTAATAPLPPQPLPHRSPHCVTHVLNFFLVFVNKREVIEGCYPILYFFADVEIHSTTCKVLPLCGVFLITF